MGFQYPLSLKVEVLQMLPCFLQFERLGQKNTIKLSLLFSACIPQTQRDKK